MIVIDQSKEAAVKSNNEPVVFPLFKLPAAVTIERCEEKQIETDHGMYIFQYPILSEVKIKETANHLLEARAAYLSRLMVRDIVDIIDRTVCKWLDPDYRYRRMAEYLLPAVTGYDADMIRLELKRMMRNFRKKELLRFLDEEFDQAAVLDEFRPRKSAGMSKAFGPSLIYHVFSGNVPGLQLWSLIMGLLLKSANLGKTSLSEPVMPILFCLSLAETDEKLAEAIAILPWKGGNTELEMPAIEAAEAVVVYGSDETVKAIRGLIPESKVFLSYGHKISFAVIGKEALTPDRYFSTIHRICEDVSVYDQQSCLSPQIVYVEQGGAVTAQQFAQMLAAEMERYHKKRPRAAISDEEAMAIRSLRNRVELEAISDDSVSMYSSAHDTAWTVLFHAGPGFEGSPLNRVVHVFACEKLEEIVHHIVPYRDYLQSCGAAVEPGRLYELADRLGQAGVSRICAVGDMNRAKAGWHHDGRFNLIDLVRFIDVERGVEQDAERYDPDVE